MLGEGWLGVLMVPHCQPLQPGPSSPEEEEGLQGGHKDGGAAKWALPPNTALGCNYCNFCQQLLDLGLEMAPLGLQWVPDPGGWWAAGSVCQTLLLLWGRQLPARARCCGDYVDPLQLPCCAEGFLSL